MIPMITSTRPISRIEHSSYKPKIVKTDNGTVEYCRFCSVKLPQAFKFCPTCRKYVER